MLAKISVMQVLVLLSVHVVPAFSRTLSCDGNEAVCAAQTGAAMLQTARDKDIALSKKGGSLEGRAATLAAEIESLTNRVSILMTTVGLAGAELVEKGTKPYEKYAALLHSKLDDAALLEVVADLEAKAAALKGNIKGLENKVSGTQFDAGLLAMDVKKAGSVDISLTNRVAALEEVVSSLRSRVGALEEKVSLGLPQIDGSTKEHALLLQNGKSSVNASSETAGKAKGLPLKDRIGAVETTITSLQERVAALETEVMGSEGAAAMIEGSPFKDGDNEHAASLALLAKGTVKKGGDDKADDLKTRVAAAEASAATLRSKIAALKNHVLGGGSMSPVQSDDGGSLEGRIVSLEENLDSMRTDVSSLEHTVMG